LLPYLLLLLLGAHLSLLPMHQLLLLLLLVGLRHRGLPSQAPHHLQPQTITHSHPPQQQQQQ
jgi:hypothetical protein